MSWIRVALALGILLTSTAIDATPRLVLEVRGERLTLHAEGIPFVVVLKRLATATGIVVNLKDDDGVEAPVNVSLEDATVEEAFRHVLYLQDRSSLFIYNNTNPRALAAVYVLRTGSRGTGAVTEPVETIRAVGEEDIDPGPSPEILRISALDAELSSDAPAPFHSAEELMAETDSNVRLTALQHLAARPESAVDALASALVGNDLVVQGAAQNMLLNSGLDRQVIEDVLAAARQGDEAKVRALLDTLHAL